MKLRSAAIGLTLVLAAACTSTSRPVTTGTGSPASPSASASLADDALALAAQDHQPPRKAAYLAPLQRLHRDCRDGSPTAVSRAVFGLAAGLRGLGDLAAPGAAAAASLAAAAPRGADCAAVATAIRREVTGKLHLSGSLSSGIVQFSPPLTAELALAAIRHSLLPGKVHVVYALTASTCQQAIFMGPALGRRYRNPSLGAFVQLTSGRGVGHAHYDANRVDRARITPLGRIGGQPCS